MGLRWRKSGPFASPVIVLGMVFAVGLVLAPPADAAKYKPKAKAATPSGKAGPSGDSGDTPTGTLGTIGTERKDCFFVRKRSFVPGTGYLVRRSTFCN